METVRAGLSRAVGAANSQAFEEFLSSESWKRADLTELCQTLSVDQARKLFVQCASRLQGILSSLFTDDAENMTPENVAGIDNTAQFATIGQIVEIMYAWCEDDTRSMTDKFVDCARMLNELILMCPETKDGLTLQQNIVRLFERLYLQGKPFANELMALALPLLIDESLGPDAKDAVVKRIWALRNALKLFDYDDESSESLKELLLRCFSSALYMKTAENRKLLGHFMATVPHLIQAACTALRAHLPGNQKTAESVGEVIYRGWSYASEEARLLIEQFCVQDFMQKAMHAAFPDTFKAARRAIQQLTEHKKTKGIDSMLLRCYEPIMFRALAAANAVVRKNAALLLFDAFPLRDPDLPKKDADAALQRQFDAIAALLVDPSPAVRETAIMGVAAVLDKYWEVIPAGVSRQLLCQMAAEISCDVTSSAVRAAVPAAMGFLSAQVLALPTLAAVLPSLAHLLHDKSDKVRAAMLALLEKVATIKTLSVAAIAPIDELLARLALDASNAEISGALVRLLMPDIMPATADAKDFLKHLVQLLATNEAAMYVFFAYAGDHCSKDMLATTALLLHKAVEVAIKERASRFAIATAGAPTASEELDTDGFRKRGKKKKAVVHEVAVVAPEPSKLLDAGNLRLMAALAKSQAILWTAIHTSSSNGKKSTEEVSSKVAVQRLTKAFSGNVIALLLEQLTSSEVNEALRSSEDGSGAQTYVASITSSLLTIAAYLPREALVDFSQSLWARLCEFSRAQYNLDPTLLTACLQCLTSWGEAENILQAATATILGAVNPILNLAPPAHELSMDPFIAIKALEHVMMKAGQQELEVDLTLVTNGMAALTTAVQILGVALNNKSPKTSAEAVRLASLAQDAAQVWCSILMRQVSLGAEDLSTASAAAEATLSVMMKVCKEILLRAGLVFSDRVERGAVPSAEYTVLVPLESGCRNIIALICATAADMVSLRLGVEPGAQLFMAVTSSDALHVGSEESTTTSYTQLSPVEWVTMDDEYTLKLANEIEGESGNSFLPVPFLPLLRLGMKLAGNLYRQDISCLSAVMRREVKLGLMRLLNLAPTPEDAGGDDAPTADAAAVVRATLTALVTSTMKDDSTGSASANAYDFFETVIPEVETTVREDSAAVARLCTGGEVASLDELQSITATALIASTAKSAHAGLALAQVFVQRLNVLVKTEKTRVTPVVQCCLAMVSAFATVCRDDAKQLMHPVITRAGFEGHPALSAVVAQLERRKT